MVAEISLAVIAASFVIIVAMLVPALLRVRAAANEAQRLLETARMQMSPMIHDLTLILADARSIVRSIDREMVKVSDSLEAVRETARSVREFEAMVQERIERPLLDLAGTLSGLIKGFRVFFRAIRSK
jgi:uncharacterized protein YoxC